jgi:3-oxoacyl-[acyl-carrier protein] reductase
MCHAAIPWMLEQGGGQIINVTSVAAFAGKGSSIPYAASKGALNNLTIALARALAPRIRVNAVAPGFITGRWLEQGLGPAYEKAKATIAQSCPLEKVCEPADVAAAIMSLVPDAIRQGAWAAGITRATAVITALDVL